MLGIFSVRTYVIASSCMLGLNKHCVSLSVSLLLLFSGEGGGQLIGNHTCADIPPSPPPPPPPPHFISFIVGASDVPVQREGHCNY